jgi:tetratricopeptide (TPR) repeat protein
MSEDMLYSTSYVRPILLLRGWIYQLNHQYDLADKDFRSMKNLLKEKIQNDPDDFRLYTALGLTLAFLGDNEKAIELGKKAVDMYPVSGDALEGSDVVIDLTWIYTIVGEHEKALEKLDYLLSIPSLMSVPYIQIDPKWDSLKSHPKYDLLLEKYSGK